MPFAVEVQDRECNLAYSLLPDDVVNGLLINSSGPE